MSVHSQDAFEPCGYFYSQARKLEQTEIIQLVEDHCCDFFDDLVRGSMPDGLIEKMSLETWTRIFRAVDIDECNSFNASSVMASVFWEHRADLNQLYYELTSRLHSVDPLHAAGLVELELGFMDPEATKAESITDFQGTCLDALADAFVDCRWEDEDTLKEFPPLLFRSLLSRIFELHTA